MYVHVHPSTTSLRGDDSCNARDITVQDLGYGLEEVRGVYRDDGVKPAGAKRRPDRPFRFIVSRDADWTAISVDVYYLLQRGASLDVDFSRYSRRAA